MRFLHTLPKNKYRPNLVQFILIRYYTCFFQACRKVQGVFDFLIQNLIWNFLGWKKTWGWFLIWKIIENYPLGQNFIFFVVKNNELFEGLFFSSFEFEKRHTCTEWHSAPYTNMKRTYRSNKQTICH